jgi:hypothetical protein
MREQAELDAALGPIHHVQRVAKVSLGRRDCAPRKRVHHAALLRREP